MTISSSKILDGRKIRAIESTFCESQSFNVIDGYIHTCVTVDKNVMIFEYTESNDKTLSKNLNAQFVIKKTVGIFKENLNFNIFVKDRMNRKWQLCKVESMKMNNPFFDYLLNCHGKELEKKFIIHISVKENDISEKFELCEFNVV